MLRKLLLAALLAQSCPAAAAEEMMLICEGSMRGMFKDRSVGVTVTDNSGNGLAGGGSSASYSDVPTTAQFRLEAGSAQLNLPQPPTCAICVGEKGWRKVKELKVEPNQISGKITYSLLYGTAFEIDRRTGIMTSRNGFTGNCVAQDLSVRKF